jgi:hypothetical protein
MIRSSKNRLTDKELLLFPDDTLLDKVGRAVCAAGCLPRKELFEAWEVARRVRRRFRGGRIVDLACGHGLTAALLLLLDDTSAEALAVDQMLPASAGRLHEVLVQSWPRLAGRITFKERPLAEIQLSARDLVVSVHACGELTDLVLDRASDAGARIAVLPCCHNLDKSDKGSLEGWVDGPMAVDITRANSLQEKGYRIYTQTIPSEITPKNRLLLAEPAQD